MADCLFSPSLISPEVKASLKPGFVVRPLAPSDYEKGFLEALSQLTTVGKLSKADFLDRYNYLKAHNYEYFTIVIEDVPKEKIVAAGTILVERKFVHGNGLVGHIEDIVTSSEYRGMNLGKLIIETLKYIGKQTGCYKIILDCSEKNIPFYVKCGFVHKEFEMVAYIDENDKTPKPKTNHL
ncbi:acyl-CoA N-acyltransferase [Blyttiomyces helicus]|uniref:Glucosamine 6-phosphate N-acetyltransferase n=1 Tax=Blyttiomyces helicus TaxID=388810 RepID=A0A4P9WMR5_9FUNG|nr:acyl-CoA N-acyltransferase [Blyttiomyces helicus]|eukprot:RKO92480.1 acyl-CoA N-acyltransferase [Blyttiomyces helicus]